MIPRTFLNTRVTLLAALGILLLVTPGCAYSYYNYYCKVFGYYIPGCIAPPPEAAILLPNVPFPADNRPSPQKEELGKMLFFDPILSADGTVSCASCHLASWGFSDPRQVSLGMKRRQGERNAPTVLNTAHNPRQFWDGRAKESASGKGDSLETQALMPIENDKEMGPPGNLQEALKRLNAVPEYRTLFKQAFGSPDIDKTRLAQAIAAFERTLISTNSPFDEWVKGEPLSVEAIRGWKVFSKNNCQNCHIGPTFTNQNFHNIGAPHRDPLNPDLGRYDETKQDTDKCKFKTPTLRSLPVTSPFMHAGKLDTLEAVVKFYNKGGENDPVKCDGTKAKETNPIMPLGLDEDDQRYLVEFLKSLNGVVPLILPPPLPVYEYP